MLFFNIALELHNARQYQESIHWCKEALEISEKEKEADNEKIARTLRLLANSNLELGNLDQALFTIQKAIKMCKTMASLYFQTRVLLALKRDTEATKSLIETLNCSDFNVNLYVKTVACAVYKKQNFSEVLQHAKLLLKQKTFLVQRLALKFYMKKFMILKSHCATWTF